MVGDEMTDLEEAGRLAVQEYRITPRARFESCHYVVLGQASLDGILDCPAKSTRRFVALVSSVWKNRCAHLCLPCIEIFRSPARATVSCWSDWGIRLPEERQEEFSRLAFSYRAWGTAFASGETCRVTVDPQNAMFLARMLYDYIVEHMVILKHERRMYAENPLDSMWDGD